VKKQGLYLYSIPQTYFNYLTGDEKFVLNDGLIQTLEPISSTPKILPKILEWLYMISWIFNLALLWRFINQRFSDDL
jgi:hypothetical protein